MGVFKRSNGKIWHYEFMFAGERIQVSSKSTRRSVAEGMERKHRHDLETGQPGASVRKQRSEGCTDAIEAFIERQRKHWARNTILQNENSLKALRKHFGQKPLNKISFEDVDAFQTERCKTVSGRSVNIEVLLLKMTMGKRLWAINIAEKYKTLPTRSDIGRALNDSEIIKLLEACKASVSKGLYPAVLLSIHTGLRSSELRDLKWSQINLDEPCVTVGKSKTVAGTGRVVDLSPVAVEMLKEWQAQFSWMKPEHYVFPTATYRLNGQGKVQLVRYDPTAPQETFKTSWDNAKQLAGIECRWHDLRHTFVSCISETGSSDATVMALSGHISRKMLERYSHSRNNAKKLAILSAFSAVPATVPAKTSPIV
jgi:integrase